MQELNFYGKFSAFGGVKFLTRKKPLSPRKKSKKNDNHIFLTILDKIQPYYLKNTKNYPYLPFVKRPISPNV